MGVENKADFVAVIGATGTGKGVFVKNDLLKPKPPRLLIWDPMEEYGEKWGRVCSLSEMARQVGRSEKFALIFRPSWDDAKRNGEFEIFCKIAFTGQNMTALVEELSLVTKPAKAPPEWSKLSNMGRHRGVRVIGTAQRPAQVDKMFLGAATTIHCNRLNYAADVKVMCGVLTGVTAEEITGLPDLHYIEKDVRSGEIRRGVTKIPKG